jgi:hypothetical protein
MISCWCARLVDGKYAPPEDLGEAEVASPEVVMAGYGGSLVAVRNFGRQRHLCVIYRQVSRSAGFIIAAYFSRKIENKRVLWRRS